MSRESMATAYRFRTKLYSLCLLLLLLCLVPISICGDGFKKSIPKAKTKFSNLGKHIIQYIVYFIVYPYINLVIDNTVTISNVISFTIFYNFIF